MKLKLPKLPIFIVEGEDVAAFQDVHTAVVCLEPIDIINSVYVGYDAIGRRLDLYVVSAEIKGWIFRRRCERVEISLHQPEEQLSEELRNVLIGLCLNFRNQSDMNRDNLERLNLDELVRMAIAQRGYTT